MPAEDDPSSPIGRSWRSTFQVKSEDESVAKAEAEQAMSKLGTTWRWLEDGESVYERSSISDSFRT